MDKKDGSKDEERETIYVKSKGIFDKINLFAQIVVAGSAITAIIVSINAMGNQNDQFEIMVENNKDQMGRQDEQFQLMLDNNKAQFEEEKNFKILDVKPLPISQLLIMSTAHLKVIFTNEGLGAMIVKNFNFVLNGKKSKIVSELFNINYEENFDFVKTMLSETMAIRVGTEIRILELKPKVLDEKTISLHNEFMTLISKLQLEIEYLDLYDISYAKTLEFVPQYMKN